MKKYEQNELRAEIKKLLRESLTAMACCEEHRACWRLADAGLMLRQLLEAQGGNHEGLTEATGRGALLPSLVVTEADHSPDVPGRAGAASGWPLAGRGSESPKGKAAPRAGRIP